jgi:hypothetical protein
VQRTSSFVLTEKMSRDAARGAAAARCALRARSAERQAAKERKKGQPTQRAKCRPVS